MEKINNSQYVSSFRDGRTGLYPDPTGADSSTVSGRTSQLEFNSATNIGIPSPEAGYRQRIHAIWKGKSMFNITDQRLMDQQSQIRKNPCLTNLELEETQRRIEDEHMVMVFRFP